MKNIAIDFLIPMGVGLAIGRLSIEAAELLGGTTPASLWVALSVGMPFCLLWVFWIYPPLARWLRG